MLPVVAIVGRPNVGKSTLFNVLTKTRDALVVDMPGVTRDRLYGRGVVGDSPYLVVDTGGVGENASDIDEAMSLQSFLAMDEADIIFFLVDARAGLLSTDQILADTLRKKNKKVFLVANKVDGLNVDEVIPELYALGLGEPHPIAASHGRGIQPLMETALAEIVPQDTESSESPEDDGSIRVAVVGRPNVGKSTLVNRMLGEDRVVVFDQPGTTRDSIFIPYERHGKPYTLIDTAGVRKRGKVTETVEKFSVIKTLQAIEAANVVILLIDARVNISDQDQSMLSFIIDSGRAVLIAINKWDGLSDEARDEIKETLKWRFRYVDYVRIHFISALHGSGVGKLYDSIHECYDAAMQRFSTTKLTEVLEAAIAKNPPPLVNGRRIKLRYAHCGGHNPPLVVIHGNQTQAVPHTYHRYLESFFRKALDLMGTPIKLVFRTGENPYKDKKNELNERQAKRRQRMIKHRKERDKKK